VDAALIKESPKPKVLHRLGYSHFVRNIDTIAWSDVLQIDGMIKDNPLEVALMAR